MGYLDIAIKDSSRHTDSLFTYETDTQIAVGQFVFVPFGKGNKEKTGLVIRTDAPAPCKEISAKKVLRVDDSISLTSEMVDCIVWMRQRYGITYADAISCFVPRGKPARNGMTKEPYRNIAPETNKPEILTAEQQNACKLINEALETRENSAFLLHGVTSSGKTEIYMRSAAKSLSQGRSSIILVPEIAMTEQLIRRFAGRFGKKEIAVLHSKMTVRERYDEWARLRNGEAHIAIGARIGIFAPLEDIGLIVMDEEHESTYKSDQTPKYETVDIAMKRAMSQDAVLILGSATPSVVSYSRAENGIYKLIELKKRYNETLLPEMEVADMRVERRRGNISVFSENLIKEMKTNLDAGKQVILFLNRRGYSTVISCRDCGETLKCPDCGVSLVYHKGINAAVCHYCGRRFSAPEICPSCGGAEMAYKGAGAEKIQEEIEALLPGTKVDRLDLDTANNRQTIRKILTDFAEKRTEILVGTQLVAKGLDFKNVGLVGVVSADVTLNIPDYRSTERTFQLITQVAGRAGRGDDRGRVIVQTYTPENFAIQAAIENNYNKFYRKEIMLREFMHYPPFTDIINAEFTTASAVEAQEAAGRCKHFLERTKLSASDHILGPAMSPSFKGKDAFRFRIMIKSPKGMRNEYIYHLRYYKERILETNSSVVMTIDVNPY